MGRKVNPRIFRIPLIREWESKWFAREHKFGQFLKEDLQIRKFLKNKLKNCGISRINIERLVNNIRLTIYTAKPGLIIGRGGVDIEKLKNQIHKEFLAKSVSLEMNVVQEKSPMLSATVVLEGAIADLEKRLPFRRVMKRVIRQVKSAGAEGAKIMVGGRLGGAEISRSEKLIWGKLPLHTLRADIDYARGTAFTLYGSLGVKVWIYRGEKFADKSSEDKKQN